MDSIVQCVIVSCFILFACIQCASGQDGWRSGRASFYGMDAWSIHRGSCGFGYQWPDIGTGWDVAALADAAPEFSGSCGRCFEVKCDPKRLVDGYGQAIDRSNGNCRDPSWTVVVRTVDNCPCYYPGNLYSNKRWCCGDNGYTHFDLSLWAFEKLADPKWGVIGLKYRAVPCTQQASNPAPLLPNPSPGEAPPEGAIHPNGYTYVRRTDPTGQPQGAVMAISDASQASGSEQVPYDSLFEGGGAFRINQANTNNAFAASNVLGSPFGGSASASSSSSASGSGGAFASASSSSSSSWVAPRVMAFNGNNNEACDDKEVPGYTCKQQKDWGKCQDQFIINGGYCKKTCGLCSSSSSNGEGSGLGNDDADANTDRSCTDFPAPGGFTCQQQKDWGKCDTDQLLKGNYCAATCGRCWFTSQTPSNESQYQSSSTSNGNAENSCADVPSPDGYTCQQQKDWGKCDMEYLVKENYCAAICGRCSPSVQNSANTSGKGCEDIPAPGDFTCQQQKDWGKCSDDQLVKGYYCAATCGRC